MLAEIDFEIESVGLLFSSDGKGATAQSMNSLRGVISVS